MNYLANVTAITLDLLDIANYSGEKNVFANKLVALSLDQVLIDLLSSIPTRNKELLEVELAGKNEFDEIYTLLAGYFGEETVKKMLVNKLRGNMVEYLEPFSHAQHSPQKNTLEQLLEETNLTNSLSAIGNLLEYL